MPVYEYVCNACGKEFEYQQRMADPDKTVCEACGKETLERIISRTAFQLKGGGWYKDLYSSSKPDASTKTDAPKSSDSAAPATPAAATPAATPAASGSSSGGSSSGGSTSGGSTSGGGSAAT